MKHRLFNLLYIACIVIYIVGELHNPWLMVVFLAGTVVKFRVTKDFIEPLSKSDWPHAWLYSHAKLWASGVHPTLNPLKCPTCKNN